jgi:tRNA pseudouridine38/39 synthase
MLQVRCMAAVLLMVGRGQEDPSIVRKLLDLEASPCKPQYAMAAEVREDPGSLGGDRLFA